MEVTAEAFFQLFTSQLTSYFIFQKFARQQSIFPDFSKPGLERVFLPVTSPNKHLEPVTRHKTEVVWAGFLQVVFPKGLSGVPMCHTGQEKNVPHTPGGAFLWSPASDWNTWKWIPPHSLWTWLWKPLHDHIAWGHLQGGLRRCGFTTTFSAFCSAIWSTSLKVFSHLKAMVWCRWKRVLGNMNRQSWPCDRLLRTAVLFHIWETSLRICCVFSY